MEAVSGETIKTSEMKTKLLLGILAGIISTSVLIMQVGAFFFYWDVSDKLIIMLLLFALVCKYTESCIEHTQK